ncbi:threonine/serine exporter family protein [Bacillus aquiflavi]|uniref:Threonine/serine exporter family protein n=1 Tax=Bacillus aquiflavi TaxID=2672567 RepID=A0A6B3VXQ1_9BACI|nr:threonine/serine exporter family protein [Bacillus aquiflavi]MBA4538731.1 threonine/serine exporter family protein [Bacillus aquiflavi]NEY83090.1 threonine/serine exporter family protein [Bacillus aquiflavi]UAC48390.1 threonine/serine exporter family protein [Bacillus aquiflavi]
MKENNIELAELEIKTIIEVCLLAGRIMMQSGAETYRVEDTMTRMAESFGITNTHSFVTPTGIIFSMDGLNPTRLVRISTRSTDLEKVARVNQISRQIASGKLQINEAFQALKKLDDANLAFPIWLQIFAAAIASGCFLIMFKGIWGDFLPAVAVGGIGFSSLLLIHHFTKVKFFAEFAASFVIGLLAVLFVTYGFGEQLDKIIIGSVMPLVPGLLITNAVRDLMAGHFVSGLSKGAEAFLTAFAIGAGVAAVFLF